MILSDKRSIARLVDICHQMGVKELVFSPGSRNAPLVISFVESGLFECLCIPDERTAAFFAMGMAIQSDRTVAICCTSGSAALNYAPALSEAYYQGVPLLVLTADRPVEWIDQGVGQSIRQNNVYANYIKKSFEFIQEASKEEDIAANDEISIQALQACQSGFKGPVHIN
ncbi:MAG: thiamine pyrophosphate-binding protein, partial [Saprospiraceae bacterium]